MVEETRRRRCSWFWRRKRGSGRENDELVPGPAYASFVGQDVEELATVGRSGRYRWPSLPMTNPGHHCDFPQNELNDPFLSKPIPAEFAGLPLRTIRSVPSSADSEPANVGTALMSRTTTLGPMSPTSIALRELYDVILRNEYDVPDSAGGAEDRTPLLGVGSGVMNSNLNRITSGRKRKGHVRQGSEEATQLLGVGRRLTLSDDDRDRIPLQTLAVRNPSVGVGRLGLREEDCVDGRSDEEDEDRFVLLPTPTMVDQFIDGPPSPRGRNTRSKAVQNSRKFPLSPSKEALPAHPRQIMSPPLESQMYFVPMPLTTVKNAGRRNQSLANLASPRARSVRPKSGPSVHPSGSMTSVNLGGNIIRRPTSPLRIVVKKNEDHRNKGKGKLVKARSAKDMD